jgi:hypothetical protein
MTLFGIFRRHAVRDPATLAAFIDEQGLLLSERIVEDYARARAGTEADALFAAPAIRAALDKARWEAYPRALAMAGEVVEGALRPHAGVNEHAVLFALIEVVLVAFDRHAPPAAIGDVDWRAARAELTRSLNDIAHRRPRALESVAQAHASYCLAIMPIDPRLQPDDFAGLLDQLKLALAAARDRFAESADVPGLAAQLAAAALKADTESFPTL